MRISQLAYFVRNLDIEGAALERDDTRISNMIRFRRLLGKIATNPALAELAQQFQTSDLFATTNDSLLMERGKAWVLFNASVDLISILRGLQNGLKLLEISPEPESVFILLPAPKELGTVIENLSSIQEALQALVLDPEIGGNLIVNSWEPGSLWIELFLGTSAGVALVAGIASAAVVVRKKWIEGDLLLKAAEGLGIKNDSLEDIRIKKQELLNILIDSEAKALNDKLFATKKDFERIERLKHSIKLLSDLIAKGAEVHPALMAPEDISGLFPKYKQLPPGSTEDQPLLENS